MTSQIRRPASRAAGFTLVELLVAMVVLGVLAAIAVPAAVGQRRKAYETSAKADVEVITRELAALSIDGPGALAISSSDGTWTITRAGTVVATGELSPHNTVSPDSFFTAGGSFCLSVRNTQVDAQPWAADDVGLRSGGCAPHG